MKRQKRLGNKGFSLVELIIVIAIMAVLIAVLAPQLIKYVEQSRAAKDETAADELLRAVQAAVTESDVYEDLVLNGDQLVTWNGDTTGTITVAGTDATTPVTSQALIDALIGIFGNDGAATPGVKPIARASSTHKTDDYEITVTVGGATGVSVSGMPNGKKAVWAWPTP